MVKKELRTLNKKLSLQLRPLQEDALR
jgi:hypothetical protein